MKRKGLFDHINQIKKIQNPKYWETLTEEDNKSKIFVRVTFSTTLNSETLQQIELDASYTAERL